MVVFLSCCLVVMLFFSSICPFEVVEVVEVFIVKVQAGVGPVTAAGAVDGGVVTAAVVRIVEGIVVVVVIVRRR